MKSTKVSLITMFALLVSAVLVLAGGFRNTPALARSQAEQVGNPGWGLVAGIAPATADLHVAFMLDQNNAWIAGGDGNGGMVYRVQYANNSWRLADSATLPSKVLGLAAVSDDNVWVVGENGLLAHKDTSGWHIMPVPGAQPTLNSIQMLGDGSEGWAGGVARYASDNSEGQPVMLHYRNGAWSVDAGVRGPAQVYRPVNALHFAAGEGYAVGIGQIWHYDGSHWGEESFPQLQCLGGATLYGVRAVSAGEAWAVGEDYCSGPPVPPRTALLHRVNGSWQRLSLREALGSSMNAITGASLRTVSFTDDGYGLFVGAQTRNPAPSFGPLLLFAASYAPDGTWHYEILPDMQGVLQSVSQADASHALAAGTNGVILGYGYGPGSPLPTPTPVPTPEPNPTPGSLPSDRVGNPNNPLVTYFPEVGHTLSGGFREYWNAHGGLAQFGYPITEEFREKNPTDGKEYTVQYFERARFEWHPENRPPYDVLLGLLGRTITAGRESEQAFLPAVAVANPASIYFEPTRHNMAPEFVPYWQTHGELPVYGYPISEPFNEVSPTDGKTYLVQYFERNRFEYHPELSPAYHVSLGLLGSEVLRSRGWVK